MLAQTTFFIGILATLAIGMLSTNLIATGIVRQQQVAKYATLASDDAVANFTARMRSIVAKQGTQGPWPAMPASAPAALCPAPPGVATCPYTYVVTAKITGDSAATAPSAQSPASARPNDRAINLQKFLIDEERVSASVSTTLSDGGGVVATDTRYLTLRVFDGTPYVMISGQRSIQADNGAAGAIEGDNGGVVQTSKLFYGRPDPARPANFGSTEILSTIPCKDVDSIAQPNTSHPSHNQGRGRRNLPWGVGVGGGFELPCTSTFATASPGTFASEDWTNGNGVASP